MTLICLSLELEVAVFVLLGFQLVMEPRYSPWILNNTDKNNYEFVLAFDFFFFPNLSYYMVFSTVLFSLIL
jgi:hypothetical protein